MAARLLFVTLEARFQQGVRNPKALEQFSLRTQSAIYLNERLNISCEEKIKEAHARSNLPLFVDRRPHTASFPKPVSCFSQNYKDY